MFAAGGEIHDGVGAVVDRGVQLFQFLFHVGSDGGVADVGVDFAERGHADGHRLEFGMVDVGGDDHAAAGNFVADQFGGDFFAPRNVFHFFGDDALASVVHLREVAVLIFSSALGQPLGPRFQSQVETVAIRAVCRVAIACRHMRVHHPSQNLDTNYTPRGGARSWQPPPVGYSSLQLRSVLPVFSVYWIRSCVFFSPQSDLKASRSRSRTYCSLTGVPGVMFPPQMTSAILVASFCS